MTEILINTGMCFALMLFLTLPKTYTPYMLFDLGAFSQTLMLAAADRVIGSLVAWNPVKYPDIIRKYMPIPPEESIAIAIALDYEKTYPLNAFLLFRVQFV